MMKKVSAVLLTMSAAGALALYAQSGTGTAVEGTLMLDEKTYPLKQALAYETTIDNEDAIAVVLSGQAISSEQLEEARATEKGGGDPEFKRPFLRLVFKKTGEIKHWSAAAGAPRSDGAAAPRRENSSSRTGGCRAKPM